MRKNPRLRNLQKSELKNLKNIGYKALYDLIPGYQIKSQEIKSIGELSVEISINENSEIFVFSIAKENQETFVSSIVLPGKSFQMQSRYEDGFNISPSGVIVDMHSDEIDDD